MSDVRLATGTDAARVADILSDAFSDDPVMRWAFESGDLPNALGEFFAFLAREEYVPLGATYVLGDSTAAAWSPPGSPPWPDERTTAFVDTVIGCTKPGTIERIVTLDEATKAVHPKEPHWYLGLLATRCGSQNRGVGGTLLRHCLEQVDAARMPAYLESSNPRNVPFYERHGFRRIGSVDLPDGPSLVPMWRDAQEGD